MPSKILDGKALAQLAEEDIKLSVSKLKENGITPTLATILVGVDPASATYVKMKQNACARLGMESIAVELSKDTSTQELLKVIEKASCFMAHFYCHFCLEVPNQGSRQGRASSGSCFKILLGVFLPYPYLTARSADEPVQEGCFDYTPVASSWLA